MGRRPWAGVGSRATFGAMTPDLGREERRICPVLVGRDDLLALVLRRLDEASDGRGQLLLLTGEAGVGKTRLLAEVCERATAAGALVVRVAAFPRDAEVVGGLLADLAIALGRLDDPSAVAATEALLAAAEATQARDAVGRRRALVIALAEALLALGERPTLVALEDLHWTDEITLAALERAAAGIDDRRLLVVATCRSDELYPRAAAREWRARLLTRRQAEEARVRALDATGTAAMVAAIRGEVAPSDVVAAIHGRSDGLPLHVEELLAAGHAAAVPETLADAVLARVDTLRPTARATLEAAAVIGRSFDVDLLTAITGDPADVVDAALVELVDRFFVRPQDAGTYLFRHALIRDAVEGHLPPLRRRALHGAVADAAARAGFGDAFLSDQYEHAQRYDEATVHALRAARSAADLSGHRESVELFRRAERTMPATAPVDDRTELLVALADELVATDDNAAAVAAYEEAHALLVASGRPRDAAALVPRIVAARHLLGATLEERVGRLEAALATVDADDPADRSVVAELEAGLSAAYMLARRLDESIVHGEAARALAAPDAQVRLHLDATLASVLLFAGRTEEAMVLFDGALPAAIEVCAETQAARTYRMAGSSMSVLVEYDLAERWLRDGIAYADGTERWNDRHYMAAHLAHVAWATGDWDAADAGARAALADGRGGLTTQITALHVLGYVALGRGAHDDAAAVLGEARELGARMGELQRLSPALWGLAENALLRGDPDQARRWCDDGLAASAAVVDAAYAFPFVVTGTRAALAAGDLTGARTWLGSTSDLLARRPIPGTAPAVEHARGLLDLAEGRPGTARDRLAAAAAAWSGRRRWWESAWARLDQARASARSRGGGAAVALASEVRAEAERRRASPLVTAADHVLDRHEAAEAGPLSPRELEVAVLIADGATNADVARTLTITPRTAATHVEHILAKLGMRRRAEVAAWVVGRRSGVEEGG